MVHPLPPPPPLQTKVTIRGKNESIHRESPMGPLLIRTLSGPGPAVAVAPFLHLRHAVPTLFLRCCCPALLLHRSMAQALHSVVCVRRSKVSCGSVISTPCVWGTLYAVPHNRYAVPALCRTGASAPAAPDPPLF